MIVVDRDIPYGRRPAHRLDIHRLRGVQQAPVLVLVHGGAWAMGDKANPGFIDAKAAHYAGRGWVVVSVNYRLLPWGGPREQAEDVARALSAVQQHVARWGGDGACVCLLGHSTGAHLGALVLADGELSRGLAPLQGAVLLDSAALDVVEIMRGPHLPLHERAFGDDPAVWQALSPWHRLQSRLPPLLLVSSAQRPASVVQAARFAERARALGGTAEQFEVDLGHAEINRTLGLPGALTDAVDAFLDRCAGKPRAEGLSADS